ncbi:MAG: Trm112 family protein [Planctomycetes bacterium]|nr:Trm112 family protein [Planctomycetota bacterium]
MMIDHRLLKILVCPQCHGDLEHKDDRLICTQCGLRYPIRDGIPVMLVEEAEPSESAEEPSSGSSS